MIKFYDSVEIICEAGSIAKEVSSGSVVSGTSAPAKAKEDSDNKSVKPKMRIKDMAKNSSFDQIKPILGC